MTLSVRHLRLSFEDGSDLEEVSLDVEPGRCVGLVDTVGTRTPAFLSSIAGFRSVEAGTSTLEGRDLHAHTDETRRRIGYVPGPSTVPTALSVQRALQYAAELRLASRPPEARMERLEDVMTTVDLEARRECRIDGLSNHQCRRLALGIELLAAPEVLLVEPPAPEGASSLLAPLVVEVADEADLRAVVAADASEAHALDACDRLYHLGTSSLETLDDATDDTLPSS